MMRGNKKYFSMVLAAMFLAIALLMPFVVGQIPQIGASLCPMHFPLLLCGFFCGPWYALAVGLAAPILRSFLFGMPPIMPSGIGMCFELATYGFTAGILYRYLPKKKCFIYVSLIAAMLLGRLVWGAVRTILLGFSDSPFGWSAFIGGAFVNAVPGIVSQIVLIPVLVMALRRYTYTAGNDERGASAK